MRRCWAHVLWKGTVADGPEAAVPGYRDHDRLPWRMSERELAWVARWFFRLTRAVAAMTTACPPVRVAAVTKAGTWKALAWSCVFSLTHRFPACVCSRWSEAVCGGPAESLAGLCAPSRLSVAVPILKGTRRGHGPRGLVSDIYGTGGLDAREGKLLRPAVRTHRWRTSRSGVPAAQGGDACDA